MFRVGDRIKRPRGKYIYEVVEKYRRIRRERVDGVHYSGEYRVKNLSNGVTYLAVNGKDVWVKYESFIPIKKQIRFKFYDRERN